MNSSNQGVGGGGVEAQRHAATQDDPYSRMLKREGRTEGPRIGGCPFLNRRAAGTKSLCPFMNAQFSPSQLSDLPAGHPPIPAGFVPPSVFPVSISPPVDTETSNTAAKPTISDVSDRNDRRQQEQQQQQQQQQDCAVPSHCHEDDGAQDCDTPGRDPLHFKTGGRFQEENYAQVKPFNHRQASPPLPPHIHHHHYQHAHHRQQQTSPLSTRTKATMTTRSD